jgi:hypothetical protein
MSDAFRWAQEHYARIRRTAYAAARDEALASGRVTVPLRLAECDRHALSVWRATWVGPHPSGWGSWDWEQLASSARKRTSAFHLAIWSGDLLCGLAVGRVSDRDQQGHRNAISIHFIESAHDRHHPLRGQVASLAITAAEAYGRLLGVPLLRLAHPLPGVLNRYLDLGFTPVLKRTAVVYCERRIEP